jgi:hypothetical protein
MYQCSVCMFVGLPDPHPDPYKNVTDPQHCDKQTETTSLLLRYK